MGGGRCCRRCGGGDICGWIVSAVKDDAEYAAGLG